MLKTFEQELQELKPWDEVQGTTYPETYKGYPKILTSGHGYLVVRLDDMYADKIKDTSYSFKGKRAWYLEEDSEAHAFLDQI